MKKITTFKQKFIDSDGRERIFNGVNLCDKGYNKDGAEERTYDLPFGENLIRSLSQNGFNLIRLGITWDAVEPEPFKYNEEFLDRLEKVADLCAKYGIYFYLDMHQDLYAGFKGMAGDGAPKWACLTDGAKFQKTRFVWAEGYFWGKATQRSFDNFWNNAVYNGIPLQTYFCKMWQHVAERFKDHPALFGFDMLNEPFPGTDGGKVFRKLVASVAKTVLTDKRCNIGWMAKQILSGNAIKVLEPFDDPDLFRKVTSAANGLIYKFDVGAYSQFLNRTAKAIRNVTDNGIMMMENSYYSNLGIPYSTPVINYNGKREEKVCFAPHAYDLMVDTPAYKYASNSRVGSIFDQHRKSQQRLDVPVVVGEWGGHSEGTEWLHHIRFLLDKFDSNRWSNTYWAYYDGMLENPIMDCLNRTSPIAVCGDIVEYKTDRENDTFTLIFEQDKKYDVPTEVYLHKKAKSIECTSEYELEPIEGTDASILKINGKKGTQKLVINF